MNFYVLTVSLVVLQAFVVAAFQHSPTRQTYCQFTLYSKNVDRQLASKHEDQSSFGTRYLQGSKWRNYTSSLYSRKDKSSCRNQCADWLEEDENDTTTIELDRREAAFALLGTLWAVTGTSVLLNPTPAFAKYGSDAKVVVPNPYDALNNRFIEQCRATNSESQDCIQFAGSVNYVYQGADNKVLFDRFTKATTALESIPGLVESTKWSQVTGILTGPMGELIATMGQLANLSDNNTKAKALIKVVKNDLYSITDAVKKKDPILALKNHNRVTLDLVTFVESL